jgi:hypothetical protein
MSEFARPIDVTDSTELRRIVEQVQKTHRPVPIMQDSEIVAVVQPVPVTKDHRATLLAEAEIAAARSTFGALKGILDERKMQKIYEARGSNRPPAKL